MAQLEFLQGGGSSPPPSGGKKKLKLNKKTIVIYGGLAIAAFVLISTLLRRGGEQTSIEAGGTIPGENGLIGGGGGNIGGGGGGGNAAPDITGQLEAFQTQMQAQLEAVNKANASEMAGIIGNITSSYDSKLMEQSSKYDSLYASNQEYFGVLTQSLVDQRAEADERLEAVRFNAFSELEAYKKQDTAAAAAQLKASNAAIKKAQDAAAAAKKAADAAVKKTVTKAAPKPVAKKAAAKPVAKAAPKKLNTSTSIVDYLKSTGKNSSYAARAALAKQKGIKNYKGTAAQNTALLKAVRK